MLVGIIIIDVSDTKLVQVPRLQREDEVPHRRLPQEYITTHSDSKSVCLSSDATFLLHNSSKSANLHLFNASFTGIAQVRHRQCRASKSGQSIPWNAPATSKDRPHSRFSTPQKTHSTPSASRTEKAKPQRRRFRLGRTCRMTASKYCRPP